MLESGGPDQNQDDLLNLLGMESVEFVFTIMEHRDALLHPPEVLSESMITTKGLSHVRHLRDGHHDHRDDGNININGNITIFIFGDCRLAFLDHSCKGFDSQSLHFSIQQKRNTKWCSFFTEIAETGFEPATSGL